MKLRLNQITKGILLVKEEQITQNRNNEIVKKELVEYEVEICLSPLVGNERNGLWEIKDVRKEHLNIDDDIDEIEKFIKGCKIEFKLSDTGELIGIENLNRVLEKIKGNMNKIDDNSLTAGSPFQEQLFGQFGEFMIEIEIDNLIGLIKKYYKNYGLQLPKNLEKEEKGTFNRKLAKTKIPSINKIKSYFDNETQCLDYKLTKNVDNEGLMKIFEKNEEEFKPFDKKGLKELFLKNEYYFKFKETIKYDTNRGLIQLYEEKVYTKLGGKLNIDILSFTVI